MISAAVEPQTWSRRKWWRVVLGLSVVQIALLCWFGARGPVQPRPVSDAPQFRFAGVAAAELIELMNPTLFAQSHPQGFSGAGWMAIPVPEYQPPEWSEPPRWLALDSQQLGGDFRRFVQTNRPLAFAFAADVAPALASLAINAGGSTTAQPSRLRVERELANRRMLNPPLLKAWPHPDLLTNSVVQVLVDGDGNVFSPVLLARSGNNDADETALAVARSLHFEALEGSGSRAGLTGNLTWGTLVFEWQTLPFTNAAPAGP